MTKRQIQNELTHRHISFAEYTLTLDHNDYTFSFEQKWTAGQQLEHIVKSSEPILLGLKIPLWLLGILFGKSKKASMDYKQLVQRYHEVLSKGGKSSRPFIPKTGESYGAEPLKNRLLLTISKINLKIEEISEEDLDHYRLPHPLLGKLTLREMLFFTIYHVEHHMEQTKQNLRYLTVPPR